MLYRHAFEGKACSRGRQNGSNTARGEAAAMNSASYVASHIRPLLIVLVFIFVVFFVFILWV